MLTEKELFFDTDCISAFLWIDNASIITKLYHKSIAIPIQVYNELQACRGQAIVLKERIDLMVSSGDAIIVDMEADSKEYEIYSSLAVNSTPGTTLIGRGEAACIALAKERNGILASNNMRDITKYIEEYNLEHITTGDILVEAYKSELLSKDEIENIWRDMLSKRRRLGAQSFEEYLNNKER